jgi:hypothetical protein
MYVMIRTYMCMCYAGLLVSGMAVYSWPHCIANWTVIQGKVEILKQWCTNSKYWVAQANKLWMVAPNVFGSSVRSLRHVTELAHRILRLLLAVRKMF